MKMMKYKVLLSKYSLNQKNDKSLLFYLIIPISNSFFFSVLLNVDL